MILLHWAHCRIFISNLRQLHHITYYLSSMWILCHVCSGNCAFMHILKYFKNHMYASSEVRCMKQHGVELRHHKITRQNTIFLFTAMFCYLNAWWYVIICSMMTGLWHFQREHKQKISYWCRMWHHTMLMNIYTLWADSIEIYDFRAAAIICNLQKVILLISFSQLSI